MKLKNILFTLSCAVALSVIQGCARAPIYTEQEQRDMEREHIANLKLIEKAYSDLVACVSAELSNKGSLSSIKDHQIKVPSNIEQFENPFLFSEQKLIVDVSASKKKINAYSFESGIEIQSFQYTDIYNEVVYSPIVIPSLETGKIAFFGKPYGKNPGVDFFDLNTKKKLSSCDASKLGNSGAFSLGGLNFLAVSPDTKWLARLNQNQDAEAFFSEKASKVHLVLHNLRNPLDIKYMPVLSGHKYTWSPNYKALFSPNSKYIALLVEKDSVVGEKLGVFIYDVDRQIEISSYDLNEREYSSQLLLSDNAELYEIDQNLSLGSAKISIWDYQGTIKSERTSKFLYQSFNGAFIPNVLGAMDNKIWHVIDGALSLSSLVEEKTIKTFPVPQKIKVNILENTINLSTTRSFYNLNRANLLPVSVMQVSNQEVKEQSPRNPYINEGFVEARFVDAPNSFSLFRTRNTSYKTNNTIKLYRKEVNNQYIYRVYDHEREALFKELVCPSVGFICEVAIELSADEQYFAISEFSSAGHNTSFSSGEGWQFFSKQSKKRLFKTDNVYFKPMFFDKKVAFIHKDGEVLEVFSLPDFSSVNKYAINQSGEDNFSVRAVDFSFDRVYLTTLSRFMVLSLAAGKEYGVNLYEIGLDSSRLNLVASKYSDQGAYLGNEANGDIFQYDPVKRSVTSLGLLSPLSAMTGLYELNEKSFITTDGFSLVLWNRGDPQWKRRFLATDEGEWILVTPDGYFDASEKGANSISVLTAQGLFGIEQFYDDFYRPDIVYSDKKIEIPGTSKDTTAISKVLNEATPPNLSWIGEVAKGGREYQFNVRATDTGGGIGKLIWKVNGIVVGLNNKDRALKNIGFSSNNQVTDFERVFTLAPGQNDIEVLAYNAANSVTSRPVRTTIDISDAISEKPSLHLLAIGVNQYRDKSLRLKYAVPDANMLSAKLKNVGRKIFEEVNIINLLDAEVTKQNIEKTFKSLSQQADTNDVFIMYLAGHGVTQDGKYHFLPVDFRYRNEQSIAQNAINQSDIQNWLSQIQSLKSLMLLDTCNSGSYVQAQAVTRGLEEKTAINKLTRATGRTTIAASTETQVAFEGYQGHGVFTWAILRALERADDSHGNEDGITTTNELISFIDETVPEITYEKWNYEQIPQVSTTGRPFPIGLRSLE